MTDTNLTNSDEIVKQLSLLEAPMTTMLEKGTIKKAMIDVSDKFKPSGEQIASSRDLWQCIPGKLKVVEGLNPRVETPSYLAHVRATANSMLSEGFFQDKPLAGYVAREDGKDVVYIYEGGTRLRSALLAISEGANFKTVPVSVCQEGLSMEDILVAMMLSNEGRPFSFYEKAVMVKRLVRNLVSVGEISSRLTIEPQVISNMLTLMESNFEIRHLVATEIVAATFAIDMIHEHGANALDVILSAKNKANAAGKSRVTKRFVPGANYTKAIKKAAPVIFSTLNDLVSDPGFKALSEDNRLRLEQLIQEIEATKDENKQEVE